MNEPQLFDKYLFTGFDRQKEICQSRSAKYADTYRDCQWLWMKAVAKRLGAQIPQDAFMAIALAAYADQKYQRMQGGYDEDHGRDGTNYQTVCIECVKHVEVDRQLAYRKAESAAQKVDTTIPVCSHTAEQVSLTATLVSCPQCGVWLKDHA